MRNKSLVLTSLSAASLVAAIPSMASAAPAISAQPGGGVELTIDEYGRPAIGGQSAAKLLPDQHKANQVKLAGVNISCSTNTNCPCKPRMPDGGDALLA